MPQMMPMNWIFLFILFIIIFLIFNIMNFYIFNFKIKFKKMIFSKKKMIYWKW